VSLPAYVLTHSAREAVSDTPIELGLGNDLLMKAAAETTLTIAADAKRLGARIGITAVLHTWGSAMTHHPHVHMIVPGGGLSPDGAS
jgi:Putative transposase